jgi:hypothetical protein
MNGVNNEMVIDEKKEKDVWKESRGKYDEK